MALAHTIENKVGRAYRRGDLFDQATAVRWTIGRATAASGLRFGAKVTPYSPHGPGKGERHEPITSGSAAALQPQLNAKPVR
jgi:hypothetical protein